MVRKNSQADHTEEDHQVEVEDVGDSQCEAKDYAENAGPESYC